MVRSEQAKARMQAILAAVKKFHDDNRELPSGLLLPRGSAIGPNTKVQHFSWRVQILPNLGEEYRQLYEKFDFSQPWDSDHNLEVANQMPDIYRSPYETKQTNHTSYLAVAGKHGAFPDGDEPNGRRSISATTDGPDKTVAIVAVQNSAVIWTEPRDLTVDEFAELIQQGDVAGVAEIKSPDVLVCMLDFSLRHLPKGLPAATAKALGTRAGGDRVDLPK
jgi:hypothetical protein